MVLLINCQNKKCGNKIAVNKIPTNTENLTFENLVNIVTCPYCGTKNKVTVTVSKIKEEKDGKEV